MTSPTLPAWLEHFADILDAKSSKQFRKAYAARSSVPEFLTRIIRPHLYDKTSYTCLARRKHVPGRNHFYSKHFDQRISDGNHQVDDLKQMTFFANALKTVSSTDPLFHQPSGRVIIRGPHVFTFEIDQKDLSFIETQLAWFRPKDTSKPLTCPIGELFKELSQYIDFQGITVAWSGNKSFHVHIVFDTGLALAQCPTLASCDPRQGFVSYWKRLETRLMATLDPRGPDASPVRPDASLRFPEALRRLPGGSRTVEDENVLEIPVGTHVPQLVMWERYRDQAGAKSDALFLSPTPFLTVQHVQAKTRNLRAASIRSSTVPTHLPVDEYDYILGKLREFAPAGSYPSFEKLNWTINDGWTAYFANSDQDQNPASVMKEAFSAILVQGTPPSDLAERRLPRPLGEQIAAWREEYINDLKTPEAFIYDEDESLEVEIDGKHITGSSSVETLFTSLVESDGVDIATKKALEKAFSESRYMLIKGPEGMRKTSTVMNMHAGLMNRMKKFGLPHLGLYAFVDYVGAVEKCAEFNNMQMDLGTSYRGIVIPSFNALYEQACSALRVQKMTHSEAGKQEYGSLWEAVNDLQKPVLGWMADYHEKTWGSISAFDPVLFCTHETAHSWKYCSYSRLMWSRDFWTHLKNGADCRDRDVKDATRLGILVHDEIDASKLVSVERREIIDWVRGLVESDPNTWGVRTSLKNTWTSFEAYVKAQGGPVVNGKVTNIPFERVREIAMGSGWENLALTSEGAYEDINPENLIYTACLDHQWAAKSRRWWRTADADARYRVAEWVVLLTTEELPTAVARQSDRCWSVYSLEAPAPTRSVIEVFLDRSITANRLPRTCEKYREDLGEHVQIISNSVKMLAGTRSPTSARGANGYVGQEVLQTLPFVAVELHERMLVWNAYTGRDDCLALHHTDMINQTAGRNMGFRYREGARHYLVAHPRLFNMLLDRDAFGYLRYDLMLRISRNQRAHLKIKATSERSTPNP